MHAYGGDLLGKAITLFALRDKNFYHKACGKWLKGTVTLQIFANGFLPFAMVDAHLDELRQKMAALTDILTLTSGELCLCHPPMVGGVSLTVSPTTQGSELADLDLSVSALEATMAKMAQFVGDEEVAYQRAKVYNPPLEISRFPSPAVV